MAFLGNTRNIWRSLNGVVCVFKPAETSVRSLRKTLINKIIAELNGIERKMIEPGTIPIEGPEDYEILPEVKSLSVSKQMDLSTHPNVTGPKYSEEELAVSWSNYLGWHTSGVLVFGLKSSTQAAKFIRENLPTRCYRITCSLGTATDNGFANGKVVEKSTWRFIKPHHLERILSLTQSSHQKKMYELCGVDIQSQLAYELAIKGPIRPVNSKIPIIYGLKCVDFSGPEFTLEIQCVNEYETYLALLIRDIAMKLHSTAHCISIKCIRHSCFNLEHALLMKHWTLENIVSNMGLCADLLNRNRHLLAQDSIALRQ